MRLLKIVESSKPEKKMMAVFETDSGRTKTVHFGQRGADDYTISKSKEQRDRYLNRHRSSENWDKYDTSGSLSRWILWGDSVSRQKNIASFKQRFNL